LAQGPIEVIYYPLLVVSFWRETCLAIVTGEERHLTFEEAWTELLPSSFQESPGERFHPDMSAPTFDGDGYPAIAIHQ
jgi:hypothetical protein